MSHRFIQRVSFVSALRVTGVALFVVAFLIVGTPSVAQWTGYIDETATRVNATPTLGVNDIEEKDFAWGDVDNDGDIDLVVARKEPFTSAGKRQNVLFMNENGVLVDRTFQYASASNVVGDDGFLTPTNDRDIQLADLNGDGWLDIVTAPTISDGDPKHIGHPRIYINLRDDQGGNWLGFRYEVARIPTMSSYSGATGVNPRFCSVAVGDVTGDGAPDLWFGDYDSAGVGGLGQPPGADFNDRLLANNGAGKFVDVTSLRFSGVVPNINAPFEVSAFGAAGAIADMNGDGFNDIVKQTSLSSPLYVGVAYNDPNNEGFFDTFDATYTFAPYFITVDDLNNDNKMDIVITDDGADRYLLNTGNDVDGKAIFTSNVFSFDAASDDGFGGNNLIVDLDNDGFKDVLVADVDVDIPGCSRRMHIYRNLGGLPGDPVVLQEQTQGTGCATGAGNPPTCSIVSIPANKLEGVHDVAVFDLDGDGWKDMILGRCSGMEVYINDPPVGLAFSYPQGLPAFVEPGVAHPFQVQVNGFGGAVLDPSTTKVFASVDGAPFAELPLVNQGGGLYDVVLPAVPTCTGVVSFYATADAVAAGGSFFDPSGAPAETYRAIAAFGSAVSFEDNFEGNVAAWTVVNDPLLTSGGWEAVVPIGTIAGGGLEAAPSSDADAAQDAVIAFVTENGPPLGAVGLADVDGGPTDLISPAINLDGTDGLITYSRWFFSDGDDTLTVWVTGDGTTWHLVETVGGGSNFWQASSFKVGDFIVPTATVQVRFRTSDPQTDSITEAGIDAFRVEQFLCQTCTGDAECSDGVFCNGVEQCLDNICNPAGSGPCPGQLCDEGSTTCVDCFIDAQCNDGNFCNGEETCVANACVAGTDACPGQPCDDVFDLCLECVTDSECDDGVFCNGVEICSAPGQCTDSIAPACPALCDEDNEVCVGNVDAQPRMGMPLLRLTEAELGRFEAGKTSFNEVLDVPGGLGPIFNQNSCGVCHSNPTGGSGTITVTRFGFNDDKGGVFDPLPSLGGSLEQSQTISVGCEESVPPIANIVSQRLTTSTLGLGLIEAIPDAAIEANALNPPPGVSGRVHMAPVLENAGQMKVGRLGWKAQLATVLSFSADAALNEMGLTNRLVTTENAPNGDLGLLATCDTVPDPEDGPDAQGLDFIDRVTDFQRFLAPPPQTPRSGTTGELFFNLSGCNTCHVRQFTTSSDASLEEAIRDQVAVAYSDFLLHDMGQSADFIEQGDADQREIRTTPLWGIRARDPLWHDGRVAGGTFEDRILEAIDLHNVLGSEAQASAQSFLAQPQVGRDAVVAFLDTLGRAEFDGDGDNDVDTDDFNALLACFSGPGLFYTPNDPCTIFDVDQDEDVDDDDYAVFLLSFDGAYGGRVPDGDDVPGTQLIVDKASGDEITVTWDASCAADDSDYSVYEGAIGDFATTTPAACSTGGATSLTYLPGSGSRFILAVPNNGFREGGYGSDSSGSPRNPTAATACWPQAVSACE